MVEKNNIPGTYNLQEIIYNSEEGNIYKDILNHIERPLIEWALKRAWGNQLRAAKLLGINRNTMRSKIKKLGINPTVYK